jgi:DNA invertase Pin-like site-specific DNA recombinase
MLVGYARVSTADQDTLLQRDALERAGVGRVFEEKRSAVSARPQLDKALRALRAGDVLVVYKVDRLARSLSHLLSILRRIEEAKAEFRSLTEPIDTTSPAGRLMLQLLGAFAEFERSLIRERSRAGVEAAVRGGVVLGRPRAFDYLEAARLKRDEGLSARAVGERLGVSKRAVEYGLAVVRAGRGGVWPTANERRGR